MNEILSIERLDFHKPRRPGLTSFRTLNRWWSECCLRLNESWRRLLTHPVEASSTSIETVDLQAATKLLPTDGLGVEIRITSDQIPSVVCFSGRQVRGLLADLLNQKGEDWPGMKATTPVEQAMLEVLFERLATSLGETWPGNEELKCRFVSQFDQPQRTRLFAPGTSMMMGKLNITSRFGGDEAIWLMPREPIEHLIEEQIEVHAVQDQSMTQMLTHLAERLPVTISIELGETTLNMSQIAELAIGDLLVLDQSPKDELIACVQNEDKWKGRPLNLGSRFGFSITETLEH